MCAILCALQDSAGNVIDVSCEKDEAAKWVAALEPLCGGSAAAGDFIRTGWLTREKKKFYFTLRGGYLTWYNKVGRSDVVCMCMYTYALSLFLNACTCDLCSCADRSPMQASHTTKTL